MVTRARPPGATGVARRMRVSPFSPTAPSFPRARRSSTIRHLCSLPSALARAERAIGAGIGGVAGGALTSPVAVQVEQPSSVAKERVLVAELALRHRLPSMFGTKENVLAGGLMSYAPDALDLNRRAATYVDRILRGAKPADLPVEQPSRYELVINLKTATALHIAIPRTLLARADEVIE